MKRSSALKRVTRPDRSNESHPGLRDGIMDPERLQVFSVEAK
jgi:hypothetical protein